MPPLLHAALADLATVSSWSTAPSTHHAQPSLCSVHAGAPACIQPSSQLFGMSLMLLSHPAYSWWVCMTARGAETSVPLLHGC